MANSQPTYWLLKERNFDHTGYELVAVPIAEWFTKANTEGKAFVV